ncbi:MAG: hypothetical protein COW71_07840 [Ignavibacteriales bacterium CG18_big_fil_WC_8_21_14_2_50_31_20]|nr:MAG: hypothetical protein COW71_07840 [Ignavibacteriales bacterium CG18_big_fil_WC_8_21_14_2_50_31_20]
MKRGIVNGKNKKGSNRLIINLRFVIILFSFWIFYFGTATAQLKSIEPYFGYSTALNKRLDVTKAIAYNGGARIKFQIYNDASLRLHFGYKLFSIDQTNAIEQWKWKFWDERYSKTIQSNLNAFKELSVEIGTIQKMDVIPVLLDFTYDYNVSDNFTLVPSIGGGVYFYTRRLYITESWTKSFDDINYDFSYSYRNFTPDKSGNPILLFGGMQMNYKLFEYFHLQCEVNYSHIFSTADSFGYKEFPFNDELTFNFGINIIY